IPVWVGIGHERDRVMLDEVAQQSFDTPSKVIAAIRHQLVTLTQTAQQNFLSIKQIAESSILQARHDSEQQLSKIQTAANRQLAAAKLLIDNEFLLIRQRTYQQITQARQHTQQLREMTLLQHPSTVLSRGYAIVRQDANTEPSQAHPIASSVVTSVVTSITQIDSHATVTIELQDGYVQASVTAIQAKHQA
ncbi:MAG: exodeoxyribonuclease VII large subunit, partial [Moraxella sp.]